MESAASDKNVTSEAIPAAAKLRQSCPTLCDPIDGQPTRLPRPWDSPGKNTEVGCHFLLQCMKKWKVKLKSLSCVQLLATPRTAACQALPSTGFSRQEYWSGVPVPSPGRTVWRFLEKLKAKLSYDPAIPLLGIYTKLMNILIQKDTCIPVFMVALFTIAKMWKQPK